MCVFVQKKQTIFIQAKHIQYPMYGLFVEAWCSRCYPGAGWGEVSCPCQKTHWSELVGGVQLLGGVLYQVDLCCPKKNKEKLILPVDFPSFLPVDWLAIYNFLYFWKLLCPVSNSKPGFDPFEGLSLWYSNEQDFAVTMLNAERHLFERILICNSHRCVEGPGWSTLR